MNLDIIITLVKVVTVLVILLTSAALTTLAERRLSAFVQDRLGPNRVGPQGLLQPMADFVKLIFKEELGSFKGDKVIFALAPALILIPALMLFAVIPFGDKIMIAGQQVSLQVADLDFGILYMFAISSMGVYGIVLGSWASNNKYALFGGLRAAAQMVSYELTLGLSVISILLMAGSLKLQDVVAIQQTMHFGFIPAWNILMQPLAFLLFVTSAFAETNRLPFDLAEAEQELVAGFHAEYSGMKFALFFLSEYLNLITMSALIVTLFLGGWHIPFIDKLGLGDMTVQLMQVGAFIAKTAMLVSTFIWVRWTLPRFKYNQLMSLGWKVLVPLSILNLLITAIMIAVMH